MRVAIIGNGFMAGVHAQALLAMGHELSVVVGADPKRAESFAETWNVARSGVDPLLALSPDIDCVHVCTPPALHFSMVRSALKAGKHVICEKPLTLDPEQAMELARSAEERGLVAAVNFNVRFHEACVRARKVVAEPEFGKTRLIHGSYLQEFHALPDTFGWRYKPELAGPTRAATEIGSHWIDLARFVTGLEITSVSAIFGNFEPDRYLSDGRMYAEPREGATPIRITSEDAAMANFKFSGGAIGSVVLSEVSHGRGNRLELEVCGSGRSVFWNSEDPYRLNSGRKGEGVVSSVYAFSGGFPDTFAAFFREVYKDIRTRRSSETSTYPTFRDGWRNAAVCDAMARSAALEGAWTEVRYGSEE